MRIFFLTITLFLSSISIGQLSLKDAKKFADSITPGDLKKHLTIIAGPEMEGRETGTTGEHKAAAYIESVMKEIGLKPGNGDSYQMQFPIFRDSVISSCLMINGTAPELTKQFFVTPANYTASQSFSELVYINFDDSAWKNNKIKVSGKLVMFLAQTGSTPKRNTAKLITSRINSLMTKGAAAALVIIDTFPLTKPSDLLGSITLKKFPEKQAINYFGISPQVAMTIMGSDWDTTATDKMITKIYAADISMNYNEVQLPIQSSNVLGLLEGTDKKNEYLLITAHYDHLGKKDPFIWYGADDNGSGTVSVLEIAKAFSKAKAEGKGPSRSILFMTVSGEEEGLWGSKFYTDHPVYPLEQTTADLNIDMIGRIDSIHIKSNSPNYVYVIGDDKISSDLRPIIKAANNYTQLSLDSKYNSPRDPEQIYKRSDHYNFAKNGVPAIFYYSGGHPDYHRVTDTIDKIDFDLMTKRAQLVFFTAWEMANRNEMLKRDISVK